MADAAIPQRNVERAKRIDKLREFYEREVYGEKPAPETSYTHLAGIVTDMRHWCDVHGVDFSAVSALSEEHYDFEQGEEGE